MKILPVRKRLAKPLAGVATWAGRRGNYRFRPADVFVRLFLPSRIFIINDNFAKSILSLRKCKGAVPKVMSVAFIEPLVEMTATLNVVVSINSTTVMQTYGQPQNKRNLGKIVIRQMYCAGSGACNDMRDPRQIQRQVLTC